MILVTITSVLVVGLLSAVDTGTRATTALRDQGEDFYTADGAAQVAVNTIRNSTYTGQAGQTCFPDSDTLELVDFNGRDSAAVTCTAAEPNQPSCPGSTGCDPPTLTARVSELNCAIETLWVQSADNRIREVRPNGSSTGRVVTSPSGVNYDVALSPDGATMYILAMAGRVYTVNVANSALIRTTTIDGPGVPEFGAAVRGANSLSVAPNGRLYLGNSSYNGGWGPPQPIMIVDPTLPTNNTRVIGTLPGASGGDFVTMPDGNLLASAADGSLYMFRFKPDGTLHPAVDVGSVPRHPFRLTSYGPFGLASVNGTVYAAYSDGLGRITPTPSINNPPNTTYNTAPMLRTPANLSNNTDFYGAASAQESTRCSVPTTITVSRPTVSGPTAGGVYTATSTVTVTNSSALAGAYGGLTLTGASDPTVTVTGATWTRPDLATGSGSAAGPWTISTDVRNLSVGATDTYQVAVTFTRRATTVDTEVIVHLETHLCPNSDTCGPDSGPVRRVKVAFTDADPAAPVRGQRQVRIISWSNQPDPGQGR